MNQTEREKLVAHWRARFCVRHGSIDLEEWEGEGEFLLRQTDVEEFIRDVVLAAADDGLVPCPDPYCIEGRIVRMNTDEGPCPLGCIGGRVPLEARIWHARAITANTCKGWGRESCDEYRKHCEDMAAQLIREEKGRRKET